MTYEEILAQMQQTYRASAGFDPDSASDIGLRLRVLAEQLAALYERLEQINRRAFPQTSAGEALERHAQCRGLFRKPARRAEGTLHFSRELPAAQDIPIAAGTLCATGCEPQIQFETVADAVLFAGESSAEAPARAVLAGEEGNAAPGAVRLMVSAATGVSGVSNPTAFAGGADAEGDEALRARLLLAFRNISNGANSAFYYDVAMGHEDVASAAVVPRARGRGTVDVAVYCAANTEQAVAALQETFRQRREIGVDVSVYPATVQGVDLTVRVEARSGSDFEAVCAACGEEIRRYVASLAVGEPLLIARLTGKLLALDGVYNAAVRAPEGDVFPLATAVVRPQNVVVERMAAG